MRNLTISLPLDFDDSKTIMLYIPEPSFDRVEACLPVFRFVFENQKLFSNTLVACKDFDYLIKDVLRDDKVRINFNAFLDEAIESTKIVNDFDKSFQDLYKEFDDDEKNLYKTILVFVYALLRYLPVKLLKKELSEFYTLLSYADYRGSFLSSTEVVSTK